MAQKTKLSFRNIFDLNFGFFGVQIAYALQSANISRIFATLGADPHQLSFFWILPPLMGMLVQPLVGKYSDRTWCRMGRRKPYLLGGALVALLVMLMLPNAGSIDFGTKLFLGLNGAMWFGLFSLMLLDTSINVAMQPFKMMVGDMVGENQKAQGYSVQSFLCNAGSLVGYLFPIFLTWIGLANTAPAGVVPDSVIWSFYCGAAILILCVLYTFFRVKEMAPEEYAKFHSLTADGNSGVEAFESLAVLLRRAPKTFWTVSLVQFFCWAAFLLLWTYTNGAIADTCWGVTDAASEGYQAAGNWVGLLFAIEAAGAMIWALIIPRFRTLKIAYAVSLILGAIGFLSIFFIHDKWLLFASFILVGFVWAAMLAIPFTFVTNALTDHIGTYLGLFNCSICLPQIVAAATGGWMLSLMGGSQAAMFIIAAVLLLLGAACTALIKENNKQ